MQDANAAAEAEQERLQRENATHEDEQRQDQWNDEGESY